MTKFPLSLKQSLGAFAILAMLLAVFFVALLFVLPQLPPAQGLHGALNVISLPRATMSDSSELGSNVVVTLELQMNDYIYVTDPDGKIYRMREPGIPMFWISDDGQKYDLGEMVRRYGPLTGTWVRITKNEKSWVEVYKNAKDVPTTAK